MTGEAVGVTTEGSGAAHRRTETLGTPPCTPCGHRALPLVCQRFQRLVHTPQLLHSVCLTFPAGEWLPRLRALCRWMLLRAAGSVRQLRLGATAYLPTVRHACEVEALVASSVVACAAGGGLHDLELSCGLLPAVSSWLVALRGSLRRLSLHYDGHLIIETPLEILSSLQELHVHAEMLEMRPPASPLPPSLTQLSLGPTGLYEEDESLNGLPSQVRYLLTAAGRQQGSRRWCFSRAGVSWRHMRERVSSTSCLGSGSCSAAAAARGEMVSCSRVLSDAPCRLLP